MYKPIILPVVLYGYETWSLTLRKEHRPRVFENRGLRRMDRRDEIIGGWRKLHNEEFHNLYSSPNIIRMVKTRKTRAGNIACMGGRRNAYRILVRKTEGKKPLGRLDVGGRIILRWMGWYGLDVSGRGLEPVEGSCKYADCSHMFTLVPRSRIFLPR
jgi:hypothetical protein